MTFTLCRPWHFVIRLLPPPIHNVTHCLSIFYKIFYYRLVSAGFYDQSSSLSFCHETNNNYFN